MVIPLLFHCTLMGAILAFACAGLRRSAPDDGE
jgi:hypothetical protein